MELHIVTPEGSRTVSVAWLEVNTPLGNFVIQQGHTPTLFLLSPNKVAVFKPVGGKKEQVTIHRGVAEVDRKRIVLLLNDDGA